MYTRGETLIFVIRIAVLTLLVVINGCDSNSSPTGTDSSPAISFANYPDITTIQLTDEVGNELGISGDGISSACSTSNEYPDRSSNDGIDINIPTINSIGNVYPNPFNPNFSVRIIVNSSSSINLFIVNDQNTIVCEVANDTYDAGDYTISGDMSTCSESISPGYYRLIVDFGDSECFQNLHYYE